MKSSIKIHSTILSYFFFSLLFNKDSFDNSFLLFSHSNSIIINLKSKIIKSNEIKNIYYFVNFSYTKSKYAMKEKMINSCNLTH